MVVHVPDAGADVPGGAVLGVSPVTTPSSYEGQEVAPPHEADAPEASASASFAGGVHLHINTQSGQASMAS